MILPIKQRRAPERIIAKALMLGGVVVTLALIAAGCGGDDSSSSASGTTTGASSSGKPCNASIGVLTVLTGAAGPQGREMLHWAQLAVDQFNAGERDEHQGGRGRRSARSGAGGNRRAGVGVERRRSLPWSGRSRTAPSIRRDQFSERPGLAMVSSTATSSRLTEGKYPTFYRVIPPDSLQGSQDAQYMIDNLKVKKVFVIDDQSAYSKGIADVVVPKLRDAGVDVSSDSVSQTNTDYSALVSKVADDTDVVFLPWMLAANAQLFGDQMAEQVEDRSDLRHRRRLLAAGLPGEGLLHLDVLAGYPERPELRRSREGVRGQVRAVRRVRSHDLSGDPGRARRGQEGV